MLRSASSPAAQRRIASTLSSTSLLPCSCSTSATPPSRSQPSLTSTRTFTSSSHQSESYPSKLRRARIRTLELEGLWPPPSNVNGYPHPTHPWRPPIDPSFVTTPARGANYTIHIYATPKRTSVSMAHSLPHEIPRIVAGDPDPPEKDAWYFRPEWYGKPGQTAFSIGKHTLGIRETGGELSFQNAVQIFIGLFHRIQAFGIQTPTYVVPRSIQDLDHLKIPSSAVRHPPVGRLTFQFRGLGPAHEALYRVLMSSFGDPIRPLVVGDLQTEEAEGVAVATPEQLLKLQEASASSPSSLLVEPSNSESPSPEVSYEGLSAEADEDRLASLRALRDTQFTSERRAAHDLRPRKRRAKNEKHVFMLNLAFRRYMRSLPDEQKQFGLDKARMNLGDVPQTVIEFMQKRRQPSILAGFLQQARRDLNALNGDIDIPSLSTSKSRPRSASVKRDVDTADVQSSAPAESSGSETDLDAVQAAVERENVEADLGANEEVDAESELDDEDLEPAVEGEELQNIFASKWLQGQDDSSKARARERTFAMMAMLDKLAEADPSGESDVGRGGEGGLQASKSERRSALKMLDEELGRDEDDGRDPNPPKIGKRIGQGNR